MKEDVFREIKGDVSVEESYLSDFPIEKTYIIESIQLLYWRCFNVPFSLTNRSKGRMERIIV